MFHQAQHEFSKHGIEVSEVKLNLEKLLGQKEKAVKTLTGGIDGLFRKNGVTRINGVASLIGPNEVSVKNADSVETWRAKNIVIATGSEIMSLPGLTVDERTIVSSTGALSLSSVPKRLLVVGGGIIGLELVAIYQNHRTPHDLNFRDLFGID